MRLVHEVVIGGMHIRLGDHQHPVTLDTLHGRCRPSLHNVRNSDVYEVSWPCCDMTVRVTTERVG